MTSDEPGLGSGRPPRLVRPYVLTQGRTTGSGGALALDACVYATADVVERPDATPEARRIIDLCSDAPMPIAEVAGRMMLPVGVIRVLVSDLTGTGALAVGAAAARDTGKDVRLLERLLDGIRTL
jgi:hypothetical protein